MCVKLAVEPYEMCVICNYLLVISSIAYEATYLVTFMLPQNLPAEFLYKRLCFQLQLLFNGMYLEESGILRENVP